MALHEYELCHVHTFTGLIVGLIWTSKGRMTDRDQRHDQQRQREH